MRVGVDFSQFPELVKDAYHQYKDIYYFPELGERLETFIACAPEESPLVVNGIRRSPPFSKHFIFEPLNALVEVSYRRESLKDWQLIQQAMEKLLQSFVAKQN